MQLINNRNNNCNNNSSPNNNSNTNNNTNHNTTHSKSTINRSNTNITSGNSKSFGQCLRPASWTTSETVIYMLCIYVMYICYVYIYMLCIYIYTRIYI